MNIMNFSIAEYFNGYIIIIITEYELIDILIYYIY